MTVPKETKLFLGKFAVFLALAVASTQVLFYASPGSAIYIAAIALLAVSFMCGFAIAFSYMAWFSRHVRGGTTDEASTSDGASPRPWER